MTAKINLHRFFSEPSEKHQVSATDAGDFFRFFLARQIQFFCCHRASFRKLFIMCGLLVFFMQKFSRLDKTNACEDRLHRLFKGPSF